MEKGNLFQIYGYIQHVSGVNTEIKLFVTFLVYPYMRDPKRFSLHSFHLKSDALQTVPQLSSLIPKLTDASPLTDLYFFPSSLLPCRGSVDNHRMIGVFKNQEYTFRWIVGI